MEFIFRDTFRRISRQLQAIDTYLIKFFLYSLYIVKKQIKKRFKMYNIKSYLDGKLSGIGTIVKSKKNDKVRYYKLPYIGSYSWHVKAKLNKLCKLSVRIVFTSFKVSSILSTKDKLPDELNARVIYKFICAGCSACYIGETSRHLLTRAKEHL
jgi:hypothetical protein